MQKIPFRHKKPVLLMAISLVLTGIVTPAISYPSPVEQTILSTRPDSASLISQAPAASNLCRRVFTSPPGQLPGVLVIYSQPSITSNQLGTVAIKQTLTITTAPATQQIDASDPSRVWVQISAPQSGWIIYRPPNETPYFGTIVNCEDTPPPPKNLCRRVVYPRRDGLNGLNIRSKPDKRSDKRGTIFFNQIVKLTTSPATTQKDLIEGERVWIEIDKPIRGCILGSYEGTNNLVECP